MLQSEDCNVVRRAISRSQHTDASPIVRTTRETSDIAAPACMMEKPYPRILIMWGANKYCPLSQCKTGLCLLIVTRLPSFIATPSLHACQLCLHCISVRVVPDCRSYVHRFSMLRRPSNSLKTSACHAFSMKLAERAKRCHVPRLSTVCTEGLYTKQLKVRLILCAKS